jgi:hypothetical protein
MHKESIDADLGRPQYVPTADFHVDRPFSHRLVR